MKKKLLTALFWTCLIWSTSFASHYIGSEFSYSKVAPAVYVVNLKIYSFCHGLPAPQSQPVKVVSVGCNPGRTIAVNKVNTQYSQIYGNGSSNVCNATTGGSNFEIASYQGNIVFSASEQLCSDWTLSSRLGSRISAENVHSSSQNGWLYTEATLKLDNLFNNFSPQFDDINPPVIIVNAGQPVLVSMSATDWDGDSISYELVTPLDDFNMPVTYSGVSPNNYPTMPVGASSPFIDQATGNCMIYNMQVAPGCSTMYKSNPMDPRPLPLQTAILPIGFCTPRPAIPPVFSAGYPLPCFLPVDWTSNCQTNVVAGLPFKLDAQNGSLEFYPSAYNPNTAATTTNRYLVSVKVKEWRKINGVPTVLSSIRRETMIVIGHPTANIPPRLAGPSGSQNNLIKEFTIAPGSTLMHNFVATDNNTADSVTMLSNAATNLQGATFTVSNAKLPTGTLTWTPAASQARSQPYYFNILLKDNASLRGYTVETIKVEVRNSIIDSMKEELKKSASLAAFPNPYTEQVNFKLTVNQKTSGQLIIYNILGTVVDRIELNNLPIGEQQITWKNASTIPEGQYLALLVSENRKTEITKFVKLK